MLEWISKLLDYLARDKIQGEQEKLEIFGVVFNKIINIIPWSLEHPIASIITALGFYLVIQIIKDYIRINRPFL